MTITIEAARVAIEAALEAAVERKAPSAIAVVDGGGNLLAFVAHQDAILAARDLAIAKAYTALSLRADTADLEEAVQPGGPFFGLHSALPHHPLVTFAGGVPLRGGGGDVIGGLGVSGGTLDDDSEISAAGAQAFALLTGPTEEGV